MEESQIMAQIQQQLTMQNHNKRYTSIPNQNIHYYEECKNGIDCKSLKYGCMYDHGINNNNNQNIKSLNYGKDICNESNKIMAQYYNNINNNKEEVKQIINTINTNMSKCIKLSNGNILLYENQLKINNKNMQDVKNKLNIINNNLNNINNNIIDINKNINNSIIKSFEVFNTQLSKELSYKFDSLAKIMLNNQISTQTELNKIDKLEKHMIITNKNQVTIQIKINEMELANNRQLDMLQTGQHNLYESLEKDINNIEEIIEINDKKLNKIIKDDKIILHKILKNNKLKLNDKLEKLSKSLDKKVTDDKLKLQKMIEAIKLPVGTKELSNSTTQSFKDDKLKLNNKFNALSKSLNNKLDNIYQKQKTNDKKITESLSNNKNSLLNSMNNKFDKLSKNIIKNHVIAQKKLYGFDKLLYDFNTLNKLNTETFETKLSEICKKLNKFEKDNLIGKISIESSLGIKKTKT